MNKLKTYLNSKKAQAVTAVGLAASSVATLPQTYAAALNPNTDKIDDFVDFVVAWLQKIGGVVALVGGVMFALGWQREDAEGKTRGLQTLMAGLMVAAIATVAKTMFGIGN